MPQKTDQVANEQHTAQLSLIAETGLELTTLTTPCTQPSELSVHYQLGPGLLVGCSLQRISSDSDSEPYFYLDGDVVVKDLVFEDYFSRLFAFIYWKEKIRQSILSFKLSLIQMLYTHRHVVVAE